MRFYDIYAKGYLGYEINMGGKDATVESQNYMPRAFEVRLICDWNLT